IVGGTIDQLGISTIGIAQSIDPGNFGREETAVVLLDSLSEPAGDPFSANSVDVASGLTRFDAVGATVAHILAHEFGHYLGSWHTETFNDVPSIMDAGGVPVWYIAGAGDDRTLGTADDQVIEFVTDEYNLSEMVAVGEEQTEVVTAFGFSTGRVLRATPITPGTPTLPLAAVRASPLSGSPPLTVEFAAGAIDETADVVYTWDFADGSAQATGPVVSHTFTFSGEFLVKVTATNSEGDFGQASVLITVSALLPTARIVATPTRGSAPLTVSFDGLSSTATTGTIVSYAWDFGDNTTVSGATVQHTYPNPGYYAVKLTVTDSEGGVSVANTLITVNEPAGAAASTGTSGQDTSAGASPQCGFGAGVMMVGSLAGLLAMMIVRRRY
ncbi:MAG: PKD domain-containing protein, partial [Planctomycetes bacterium]|nr:PKD domain-containing protein [Planctomycetota bacterium]